MCYEDTDRKLNVATIEKFVKCFYLMLIHNLSCVSDLGSFKISRHEEKRGLSNTQE